MTCDMRLLELNALVDGELPADAESKLLDHLAICPICSAEFAGLLMLKRKLARLIPVEEIDLAMFNQIEMRLIQQAPMPQIVQAWQIPLRRLTRPALLGGLIGLLLTFSVGQILLKRPNKELALRSVADVGLRQNISAQILTLAENRRGGANAWFARHHLAQLPLPDLTAAGFQFIGCRTDIVAGHAASIVVYRQNGTAVTLTAWPSKDEPGRMLRSTQVGEQSISYWSDGKLEFWVSGIPTAPVQDFTTAYRMKL